MTYLANKFDYFDAEKNFQDITSNSKTNLRFVHGLRSLSMLWIILGHTLVVQSSVGYQNPSAVLPPGGMISSRLAMIFFAARYSVDTFFFLSGFLIMRGLLYRFRQNKPKCCHWVFPFLLHRALRILPTYGFVLLLWWKLAVTWGEGPFWPRWATFVAQCDAHAWTNMLFLNNLIPLYQPLGETSECMYHTWYLGIDFQLCAILAPTFLCIFHINKLRALLFQSAIIVIIVIVSIMCSLKFDWSGHLFDGKQTVAFDRGFYIQPFFRATPYIVGTITAQLWQQKCQQCPNFKIPYSSILSLLSIGILIFLTVFGESAYDQRPCLNWEDTHTSQCGSGWSKLDLAFYNSFVRPLWSLALAIISLLALNEQLVCGVSTVLNWSGWTFISKLSFAMYLLHPLTINIWFLSRTSKFYYSHVEFIYGFTAVVTVTYFAALAIALLVEWPMSKLTTSWENKLFSTTTTTTTTTATTTQVSLAPPIDITSSHNIKATLEMRDASVVDEEHNFLLKPTEKDNYSTYQSGTTM